MIPHGVEIFVGLDPIDLRWSFDRLAGRSFVMRSFSGRTVNWTVSPGLSLVVDVTKTVPSSSDSSVTISPSTEANDTTPSN